MDMFDHILSSRMIMRNNHKKSFSTILERKKFIGNELNEYLNNCLDMIEKYKINLSAEEINFINGYISIKNPHTIRTFAKLDELKERFDELNIKKYGQSAYLLVGGLLYESYKYQNLIDELSLFLDIFK